MISLLRVLVLCGIVYGQANQNGALNKDIYTFLKSNQQTSKFIQVLEQVSQQANDNTVLTALGSGNGKVLPTDNSGGRNGYTIFVPINDALQQMPTDVEVIRNDFNNFVVKDKITLAMIKQVKDGLNITSAQTFGYKPRYSLRMVGNFYNRQLDQTVSSVQSRKKRQFNQNQGDQNQNNMNNNQNNMNNNQNNQNQNNQNGQVNNQFGQNNQNNQNGQINSEMNRDGIIQSDLNLYEQHEQMFGKKPDYQGPPISPKLPQDELYLLNSAIILDRFELTNGIVYLIDSYPQYYDSSLYMLSKAPNAPTGLGQNINFWLNRADESYRKGDGNLKNALNAYGPNTWFLPTDASFNKFTDRQLLNNDTFLVDTILKSHRVSGQVLFDYYLDDPKVTYTTDSLLPVSTRHRYVNNKVEIEVSIGHVKGKILESYRNIFCASGVIHLVDTVLGVPTSSAYKKISENPLLTTFRTLVDASSTYRSMLDRSPISSQTNQNSNNIKQMTILAPSDSALIAIKDELLKNTTALDYFLSTHIITDGSNKIFFTDHDLSVFTNGRTYTTLNPAEGLTTTVKQDPDGVSNNIVFSLQTNPSIRSMIIEGNDLTSNGVVHVVDKPLSLFRSSDITGLLEKYASINGPGQPAFSQFVDALRSTGIFNDLKEPAKQYTLFIPTNEALSRYQDIMKGNDEEKKKQLIYRHLCIDQNLQGKNLASNNSNSVGGQPQEGQLICRNKLGQDLTLTKDAYGLISKWQGMASSKIINDFPGVYSSAYLLDTPLLNENLPNLGLHKINAGASLKGSLVVVTSLLAAFLLKFIC